MKKKLLLSIAGLVVLLGGSVAGIYLVQQTQLFQKDASVSGGTATMRLSPSSWTGNIGEQFSADILFDIGSEIISGVTVKLEFPYTGSIPPFDVEIEENQVLINDHQWRYAVTDFSATGGVATIEIVATDTSIDGFAANGETLFARLNFSAEADGEAILEFNPTDTVILRKSTNSDILGPVAAPAASYTAGEGIVPDPSPTATPTTSTTPTPTTAGTPSPTTTTSPNPTGSPAPTSSPTPSPTTGSNPTNSPTPSPTTTTGTGGTTSTSVVVASPTSGASLTDTTPSFSGTSAANASITVAITGASTMTGTTTANSSGSWSWTPTTPLSGGSHTATITAVSGSSTTTDTVTFSIVTTTGQTSLPEAGSITTTLLILTLGTVFIIGGFALTR